MSKDVETLDLNYKLRQHIQSIVIDSITKIEGKELNPKWKSFEIDADYIADMIIDTVKGSIDYDLIGELFHKYRHQFVALSEGIKYIAELVENDYTYITENSHKYHDECYVEGCRECDAEYAEQAEEHNDMLQEYYRSCQ